MLEINLMLKSGEVPLYEQIYAHLTEQIISGKLPRGSKMPGRRSLAGALGVSVSTVDTAYQMMAAEGYLESRPRSGYYVQDSTGLFSGEKSALPEEPVESLHQQAWKYDLSTSSIDVSLFPIRTWGRIQKEFLDYFVLCDIEKDDFYIAEIAIRKNYQSKGYGTKILKEVLEYAENNNYERVILDADFRNTKAKALYERLGFKVFNKKSFLGRGMYNMEFRFS